MRDVDIFQMALGLTPPWEVESCEFSPEKKAVGHSPGLPQRQRVCLSGMRPKRAQSPRHYGQGLASSELLSA